MAFPNVSDIVATTIESRSGEIADNITNSNAILVALKKRGTKTISGGSIILEELNFAENSNVGWYSGYDTLPTAANDVVSAAQFTLKQASVQVIMSGLEKLQNSGKEQIIDLLDARMDAAEASMQNLIVKGIYSDGTAASGKQITGLKAAVPVANTTGTYGGIDRATWTFWRNKSIKASTNATYGSAALTKDNIGSALEAMWLGLVRGNDKPDLIIMDEGYFALYRSSLVADQRFTDSDSAGRGFTTLTFNGIPVVFEPTIDGMSANTAYFLNTKYLKFRPHRDRNFVPLKLGQSTNQDASTQAMVWAGNLTCSGARFQGILTD
jgi:hypothetical protein